MIADTSLRYAQKIVRDHGITIAAACRTRPGRTATDGRRIIATVPACSQTQISGYPITAERSALRAQASGPAGPGRRPRWQTASASATCRSTRWTSRCGQKWSGAAARELRGPGARARLLLVLRPVLGRDVPARRLRPPDQGIVPGLHLPLGELRLLRQPAFGPGSRAGAHRGQVRRAAELREIGSLHRAG